MCRMDVVPPFGVFLLLEAKKRTTLFFQFFVEIAVHVTSVKKLLLLFVLPLLLY